MMKSIKVLQVITSLRVGGAEQIVIQLSRGLIERGFDVEIAVLDGENSPLLQSAPCKVHILGFSSYSLMHIFRLHQLMRHFDIVHTHNSSPQLFACLANLFSRQKLVTTEHNTTNRKRNYTALRIIDRWMYHRYDTIVCISVIAEHLLRQYLGSTWENKSSFLYEKIVTIPNGVDVNFIHEAQPDLEMVRLKQNRKALLMVAGFRDQKDQDTLVKALARLKRGDYEVWFAGVGVRKRIVEALATSLKVSQYVRFLGLRTDIPQLLQAADIIVMSSHWEGLSLSNIEGMSASKPFVASDVNGLREVTEHWGILFQEGNDEQLAQAIERLANAPDYYKQIAKRCYERARQFDMHQMIVQYQKVYQKLVEL